MEAILCIWSLLHFNMLTTYMYTILTAKSSQIRPNSPVYFSKRLATVPQLMTSQMAPKYSALRFWYCR